LDDKEKQEEAARKEAERLAKEKAKQEEAEWKEAERLSKERAKQEKQEAERQRKETEKQAKENAKQEEAARKEAERLAKEKAKQEKQEAKATPQANDMVVQPRQDTERPAKAEQEEEAWKDAERLSRERAMAEQEEADRIKKEEAQRLAAGKKKKEKEPAGPVLYQGRVKLVIESPVDSGQLTQMEASLNMVAGLQLVMVGGAAGAAHIIVSAEEPLPLLDILEAIPVTDGVVKKDKEIRVMLKAE
jgi:hypothetical protein